MDILKDGGGISTFWSKISDDNLFLPVIFVFWTTAAFLGLSLMHMLNKKSQEKIAEELDKEENDMK